MERAQGKQVHATTTHDHVTLVLQVELLLFEVPVETKYILVLAFMT
jgi:hypothetical protein